MNRKLRIMKERAERKKQQYKENERKTMERNSWQKRETSMEIK